MPIFSLSSHLQNPWLVILAAGQGARLREAGLDCRKQFLHWSGYPLYWHSALTASRVARLRGIVFAFPPDNLDQCADEVNSLARRSRLGLPVLCVPGGLKLRQESVANALTALPKDCAAVLVHDAARPLASAALFNAVLDGLAEGAAGVIPGVDITDTVKQVNAPVAGAVEVRATLPREELVTVQTPQGFNLEVLRAAHARAGAGGWEVTDDAALLERCGQIVRVVPGEPGNRKITVLDDVRWLEDRLENSAAEPAAGSVALCAGENLSIEQLPDLSGFAAAATPRPRGQKLPRTGFGYDVHKYVAEDEPKARPMKLGGVPISGAPFVQAHSDGDVLLHALSDAILGCLALGDIGHLFPDNDQAFENMDSAVFVSEILELCCEHGLELTHVDVTIIAQIPKINPHRALIHKNLCRLLHLAADAVNVKATTEEGLGFTGQKQGIKATAVVTALR